MIYIKYGQQLSVCSNEKSLILPGLRISPIWVCINRPQKKKKRLWFKQKLLKTQLIVCFYVEINQFGKKSQLNVLLTSW